MTSLFLRGPIDWRWLEIAVALPGRALHVAIWLHLWAGIRKSNVVPVTLSRIPGVPRMTAARGLAALERARLVSVDRRLGRRPIVTIRGPSPRSTSSRSPA